MKPILLQTMPHTGNHTCQYLFNFLGGIPTYYLHFGDWDVHEFATCIEDIRDRFVIVHTMRPYEDLLATYKKRELNPDTAEALLGSNLDAEHDWFAEFGREGTMLPICGDPELQAHIAKRIFKSCGVEEVPGSAKLFLETWPPKGSFPTKDNLLQGFDSAEELEAMTKIMFDFRIRPDNDWREKVNSSLKNLSH